MNNNEILFWRVFHNVVLVRLIFKQIHETEWIEYGGEEYYKIHIDNKLKFKDINSLDWLIYNRELELLKCKLKAGEHLDIGQLTLDELFYELFANENNNNNELFKEIIILLASSKNINIFNNNNKIDTLKLLFQYNLIDILNTIETATTNSNQISSTEPTTTTQSVHPEIILECAIRYSTPLIVDSIIKLYKENQQDINTNLEFSNVKKKSLKVASWNSYEMVNYVLDGFKLKSNGIGYEVDINTILKLVLDNLKLYYINNNDSNNTRRRNINFINICQLDMQPTTVLNNGEMLVYKLDIDRIDESWDENCYQANFILINNEELCIKLIDLNCFTSNNSNVNEILNDDTLNSIDKFKMIKEEYILKKNVQTVIVTTKTTTIVSESPSNWNNYRIGELEIRNYLTSIMESTSSKDIKNYHFNHDDGDIDPILFNIGLSSNIWDDETTFGKRYCLYLYYFHQDTVLKIKYHGISNDLIECIKIVLSNYNNNNNNNNNNNEYTLIYNKIINYQFKKLLQCKDITINQINYIFNLVNNNNNNNNNQTTSSSTSKITIQHSTFNSFYYLSIKSNKFIKFILELPFIKSNKGIHYYFELKKNKQPRNQIYQDGEEHEDEEEDEMYEFEEVVDTFIEFYLNPNIFTFEYLFGNGGNGSNGGASFDQVLDELINQLIYLPIKNIIRPSNLYNDLLNYVLSYCLDIKRSDLFFKHLDIIQQQLNDKSINYGDFPNLIKKINNPTVSNSADSTTSSLLSTICKEYGFNEIEDFKQLNDGDRVFYYSDIVFGKACKLLSSNQHHQQHEFNRFISFCSFHSISNCILNPNFDELVDNYKQYECVDIYKLLNITYLLNNSKLINYLISNHFQNYYNYLPLLTINSTSTLIMSYWHNIFLHLKQLIINDLKYHEFFFQNLILKYSNNSFIFEILKNQFENDIKLSKYFFKINK